MSPVLIDLGPVAIYTDGVVAAAAFLAAMALTLREARFRGLPPALVPRVGFYALFLGLVGARLSHVLLHPGLLTDSLRAVFDLWQGGLFAPGGYLAGAITIPVVLRLHGQPVATWLDALTPGAVLGQVVAWLGAVAFGRALAGLAVLAVCLILVAILVLKSRLRSPGRLFGWGLVLMAPAWSFFGLSQGPAPDGPLPFFITQGLCLAALALGFLTLSRRNA